QNELSVPSGLSDVENTWLGNFDDNPLEYFKQFAVRYSAAHRHYLDELAESLPAEIEKLKSSSEQSSATHKQIKEKTALLRQVQQDRQKWSAENFDRLSEHEKNLHAKAFCINDQDPHHRQLETHSYLDGEIQRTIEVPKGDILHQFRQDVAKGDLPTVSWL